MSRDVCLLRKQRLFTIGELFQLTFSLRVIPAAEHCRGAAGAVFSRQGGGRRPSPHHVDVDHQGSGAERPSAARGLAHQGMKQLIYIDLVVTSIMKKRQ